MFNIQNTSNCEVSNIFSAPPTAGALVEVNGVQLIPSPFVNVNLEKNIVNDVIIGGLLRLQLSGTAVGASFDEVAVGGGTTSIKSVLDLAKISDCVSVKIGCGSSFFIDGKGKIISASASEGSQPSWVNIAPYTIEIELYTDSSDEEYVSAEPQPSGAPSLDDLRLKEYSERFSVALDEDSFNYGIVNGGAVAGSSLGIGNKHIKLSFTISATGRSGGAGCQTDEESEVKYGLAAAEKFILDRIEQLKNGDLSWASNKPDQEIVQALDDLTPDNSFLDFRNIDIDPINNTITVNGNIIYRPTGCGGNDVFTTLNIEENLDIEGNQITLSGTIQGLIDVEYSSIINCTTYLNNACNLDTKMQNANNFFATFRDETNLKNIVLAYYADNGSKATIVDSCVASENPLASCFPVNPSSSPNICEFRLISSQISRDISEGSINFAFVFSNKQDSCTIPGVSSFEIEATHDIPRDNIVELVVPGRGMKGVLTQNLCCLSADRWNFTANLTLKNKDCKLSPSKPVGDLRLCVDGLITQFIIDAAIDPDPKTNCWFVTDHQETVGKNTYRLSIQYTKPSCP